MERNSGPEQDLSMTGDNYSEEDKRLRHLAFAVILGAVKGVIRALKVEAEYVALGPDDTDPKGLKRIWSAGQEDMQFLLHNRFWFDFVDLTDRQRNKLLEYCLLHRVKGRQQPDEEPNGTSPIESYQ